MYRAFISFKRNLKKKQNPKVSETGIMEAVVSFPQSFQSGQNPTFLELEGI